MRRITRNSCFPIAICCIISVCTAQDQPPQTWPISTASDHLSAIIETIAVHHIDPPSRQQMAVIVLSGMAGHRRDYDIDSIANKIAAIPEPPAIYEAMRNELDRLSNSEPISAGRLQGLIDELSMNLPGTLTWRTIREAEVQKELAENRYIGIGVMIKVNEEQRRVAFFEVMEGGSAEAAGVKDHDILMAVNGNDTEGKDINEVSQFLQGPEGLTLDLEVRSPNEQSIRKVKVTRTVVPIKTVRRESLPDIPSVALISVDRITAKCVQELRQIETQLPDDVKTVVIDLRMTKEGDLHHTHMFADAVFDSADLGSVQRRDANHRIRTEPGKLFVGRRIALVISNATGPYQTWVASGLATSGMPVFRDIINNRSNSPEEGPVRPPVTPQIAFVTPMMPATEPIALPGTYGVITIATGRLLRPDGIPLTPQNIVASKLDRSAIPDRYADRRSTLLMPAPNGILEGALVHQILDRLDNPDVQTETAINRRKRVPKRSGVP